MNRPSTQPLVVVGVDGSESSRAALRWAADYAAAVGARLDVLTAWHVPATAVGPGYMPPAFNAEAANEKVLAQVIDEVFGADRPSFLRLVVSEGRAAPLLIEASKEADLVVVGNRGHGGFAGLMLGSVSAKVAEHAKCPVLIMHGHDAVQNPERSP